MPRTYTLDRSASEIPDEFFDDPLYTTLDCRSSALAELPEAVGRMARLEVLCLARTHVSELPDLSGCTSLREVTLGSPEMPRIPEALRGLPLTHLEITVEQLTEEDGGILASLDQLQHLSLDLRNNKCIERVPATIFALPELTSLTLETWRATLGTLEGLELATGLQELEVNVYGPTTLPDLGCSERLTSLNLRLPKATSLSSSLGDCKELEELRIRETPLTALPIELYRLPSLRKLTLYKVPIEVLPDEVGNLRSLEQLSISGASFTRLPATLGGLQRLRSIQMAPPFLEKETALTSVPDELGDLPELYELNLRGARISEVPSHWGRLPKIERLYLDNTQITTLPREWAAMPLKILHLRETGMTELPSCVFAMEKLWELSLTGNTFPPDAYEALEGLCVRELEKPRKGRARKRKAPSKKKLAASVVKQLKRLGGDISTTEPPDQYENLEIGGTTYGVPEALRVWMHHTTLPGDLHLQWGGMRFDIEWLRWDEVISEYEVTRNGPWIALAMDQHGSIWITSLEDMNPADPQVFKLDHDDFSETEPSGSEGTLSAWLGTLQA